jgi:hypothetical protein
MSPFDITNQLCSSTLDDWDQIEEKDYVSFMINRALSYHHDTIMLANEMNMRYNIPKEWQYDFYRIAITPKKKRFSKWAKADDDKNIELISRAYQVSRRKAISMLSLLSPEDLNNIGFIMDFGGK